MKIEVSVSTGSRLQRISTALHTPVNVLVAMALVDFQEKYRDIIEPVEEKPNADTINS